MKKLILLTAAIPIFGFCLVFLFPAPASEDQSLGRSGLNGRVGARVFIRGGQYYIGNDREKDNRPLRLMTFRGFFIDAHPVVNRQYARFLAESHYEPEGKFDVEKAREHPLLPATAVTLRDASAYARFYHKRLPTEWEWEIAARSLKKEIIYASGSLPTLESGNFFRYKQRNGRTPVFRYPPNALGLYDMAGNVFEWTSSRYSGGKFLGKYYSRYRLMVLRGGAWTSIASDVRVTTRTPFPAGRFLDWIGFRCVSAATGEPE